MQTIALKSHGVIHKAVAGLSIPVTISYENDVTRRNQRWTSPAVGDFPDTRDGSSRGLHQAANLVGAMPETIDTLVERAQLALREKRLADASRDWLAAIEQLRVVGDGMQLANALRSLAEVNRKLHDSTSACAHYEEAVALLRNYPDRLKLAHTIRHLGDVHHDTGRADLAAPCYDEALALYRGYPDPPPLDLANAIRSAAVLKQEMGDRQQAIALWSEARELYTAVQVEAGVKESTARLAKLRA